MLRGPYAGKLWARQFRKWHPTAPPADPDEHAKRPTDMMADPRRRKAVRETLIAHRNHLAERIARVDICTLVVMGSADFHFKDPAAEGASIATKTGGKLYVVPDAATTRTSSFPTRWSGQSPASSQTPPRDQKQRTHCPTNGRRRHRHRGCG